MDTQHRGRRYAIHVLFAGLTCVIASATGFLLTAQSQTVEIWRGSDRQEETFEPARDWTNSARTRAQPKTIDLQPQAIELQPQPVELQPQPLETDDSFDTQSAATLMAREIMAEAVTAADNGDYEEAIRIAKTSLQYNAVWTVNELTPAEFIRNWEAELAFIQQSAQVRNEGPEISTQPKLVERPTFEAPVEITADDQVPAPAPQAVSNEPVALKVPPFAWEPVQSADAGTNQESVQPNTAGTITADSNESRYRASETRLASQDNFAPDNPPHTDTGSFSFESKQTTPRQDLSSALPSGLHFNISPHTPQSAVAASGVEDRKAFYAILAVLSLIFVFGFSLVFLAVFILLKDRNQKQQQESVLRLDLGSLQGLAQLAQLGGQYVPYQQQPAPVTDEAADLRRTPAAKEPVEEISDEDAMFQHLLEDNIKMYRSLDQLPKAA